MIREARKLEAAQNKTKLAINNWVCARNSIDSQYVKDADWLEIQEKGKEKDEVKEEDRLRREEIKNERERQRERKIREKEEKKKEMEKKKRQLEEQKTRMEEEKEKKMREREEKAELLHQERMKAAQLLTKALEEKASGSSVNQSLEQIGKQLVSQLQEPPPSGLQLLTQKHSSYQAKEKAEKDNLLNAISASKNSANGPSYRCPAPDCKRVSFFFSFFFFFFFFFSFLFLFFFFSFSDGTVFYYVHAPISLFFDGTVFYYVHSSILVLTFRCCHCRCLKT